MEELFWMVEHYGQDGFERGLLDAQGERKTGERLQQIPKQEGDSSRRGYREKRRGRCGHHRTEKHKH